MRLIMQGLRRKTSTYRLLAKLKSMPNKNERFSKKLMLSTNYSFEPRRPMTEVDVLFFRKLRRKRQVFFTGE